MLDIATTEFIKSKVFSLKESIVYHIKFCFIFALVSQVIYFLGMRNLFQSSVTTYIALYTFIFLSIISILSFLFAIHNVVTICLFVNLAKEDVSAYKSFRFYRNNKDYKNTLNACDTILYIKVPLRGKYIIKRR